MSALGKRKASAKSARQTQDLEDAQAIFRRHFEAQFAPLPESQRKTTAEETEEEYEESEDDDGWDGLSGDGEEDDGDSDGQDDAEQMETATRSKRPGQMKAAAQDVVEVVDHSSKITTQPSAMSKKELKAYMSSKPPDHSADPSSIDTTTSSKKPNSDLPEDAPTLLAQDLELRRLIQESHLLKPNTATSAKAAPKTFDSGRNRLKALDLRFQALGSKDSIFKDRDYKDMKNRKGYEANKTAKETKRRREARENGVILERESGDKGKKRRKGGREMGVDRPGVGRMKGAELKISERDVRSIESSRDAFGRGGRR